MKFLGQSGRRVTFFFRNWKIIETFLSDFPVLLFRAYLMSVFLLLLLQRFDYCAFPAFFKYLPLGNFELNLLFNLPCYIVLILLSIFRVLILLSTFRILILLSIFRDVTFFFLLFSFTRNKVSGNWDMHRRGQRRKNNLPL